MILVCKNHYSLDIKGLKRSDITNAITEILLRSDELHNEVITAQKERLNEREYYISKLTNALSDALLINNDEEQYI